MTKAGRLGCVAVLMVLVGATVTLVAQAQQTSTRQEQCLRFGFLTPPGHRSRVLRSPSVIERRLPTARVLPPLRSWPRSHRVVVSAEDFEDHEGSVESSQDSVTIILKLLLETELVVVGSRAQPGR